MTAHELAKKLLEMPNMPLQLPCGEHNDHDTLCHVTIVGEEGDQYILLSNDEYHPYQPFPAFCGPPEIPNPETDPLSHSLWMESARVSQEVLNKPQPYTWGMFMQKQMNFAENYGMDVGSFKRIMAPHSTTGGGWSDCKPEENP